MNAPESVRLTEFSHGGGCGCKIAPGILQEILAASPLHGMPKELMVGTETSDDAAVYRLNDTQALVATTDFFTPIVDDPYDFGRIAATNALSDVYAMGGRPIMALAVVGMPLDKLPVAVIRRILEGGAAVCAEAGVPIAGGHSIDTLEPIYGLAALGLVHPDRVKKNSTARAGDVLVLGKPLGVGIFSAALKKGRLSAAGYRTMLAATTQLNTPGEAFAAMPDVHARLRAEPPARVADVGCGAGWSSIGLAQSYPRALVDGFDLDGPSIALARANAEAAGVGDRVQFHLRDAGDPQLAGRYQLVTAFECVHDMSRPVAALRAMRLLAGDGGAVLVADERVGDAFTAAGNDVEWMMYGWSILHCLPVGKADSESAETGTVLRPDTLRRYAAEAGFRAVEVLPIEHPFFRFYRLHP